MNMKSAFAATVSVAALLATALPVSAQSMDELITAAKAEGTLTVIASPRDWCGYGGLYDAFTAKYGIAVNSISEEAGSADELEAIKANKGNMGPQAPDTVDVGLGFGPKAAADGLLQPYKVAAWDKIPADIKDPSGLWYAGYYGVLALLINDDLVTENAPNTWADLLKDGAQPFALTGDPRKDNRGIQGVYAAGLATNGGDAATAADAGLQFFKTMNEKGTFVPVNARAAALVQGQAPVIAAWDYNLLAWQDGMKGNPKTHVVVPSDAVVAGVYVQGISAYAPHPNAAKLWMEFVYSDEGQNLWLAGYCHPILFNDMTARNAVPADLIAKLPDPALYAKTVFPSQEQQDAAKKAITEGWDSVVGANIPALQ